MKFWGTAIDAFNAPKYELPLVDNILPPIDDPTRPFIVSPTVTKSLSRPTTYPDDETVISPTSTSASSESEKEDTWFADIADTMTTHKAYFGGVGAVTLIGTIIIIFFWRRRSARLGLRYETLPGGDTLPMSTIPRSGHHDEGRHPQDRVSTGLGFH